MIPSSSLLEDCKKGDRKAQYQLFKACFPVLMGVCSRYSTDREVAQAGMNEAFLRVLTNLKGYKPEIPFEPWIKRIAINVMIDEFRKSRKVRELIEYRDFSDSIFEDPLIDEAALDADEQVVKPEELEALIMRLPPISQKVFNLYVVDDFKHHEISEMLDISIGTSKWHLSSGRKKLREWILELINSRSSINKLI
ncbi:MAG: RNA polymerase sigma factor [Saprospiraceae bacterium]|nr:RNA polymerase sigma factor [Saprospiraceae bacterium]